MITDNHYIELYINKELIELESQDSLNLRINNVLWNPTKTSTVQAEYSYSFDIPSTPHNDRILDYANNLSKTNKFRARYHSEVYADGELIFNGSLTIQKYSSKEKKYTCNLVSIKIDTLDEIFGESTLTDLKWEVPFNGAPTINAVNEDYSTKYFFPLVSYGVFQKNYVTKDEVGATYTPKHNIDEYNKWWYDSFFPSLNVLETMKKAFESKGYLVGGSAFSDPNINNIYASCNLANGQIPLYNLGNPKFGKVSLSCQWNNGTSKSNRVSGYRQDLQFPYFPVGFSGSQQATRAKGFNTDYCNLTEVEIYDVWDSANTHSSVNVLEDTYMFDKGERVIVVPADGFYKIDINMSASLLSGDGGIKADTYAYTSSGVEVYSGMPQTAVPLNLNDSAAFELQLVRNATKDDNLELIFGKKKKAIYTNSVDEPTEQEIITCFPHQAPDGSEIPTKTNDLTITTSRFGNNTSSSVGSFGGKREGERPKIDGSSQNYERNLGYVYRDGAVMAYDPVVNDNFICGFSTFSDGVASVRKNGSSWSKLYTSKTDNFYESPSYNQRKKVVESGSESILESPTTDFNANRYIDAPSCFCSATPNAMTGQVHTCIWLNKNDILELKMLLRKYNINTNPTQGQPFYYINANITFTMEAISDWNYEKLKALPLRYYTPSMFPYNLNLFNFTNKDTKIVDWINNLKTAFNLELVMDGKNVEINTNKGLKKDITYAVDIDYRVSNDESESEYISYPKEMSVQYRIDTDEWGFELTVPKTHINDEDWEKWGDSGFTIIQLNDDTYETETQNTSTNFSYTWYDNFHYVEVYEDGTVNTSWSGMYITIPVISKAEYMAEGYGYEEAMKNDGYSLTQRFWYRDQVSQEYVYLSSIMANNHKEIVYLTYPMNQWNGFNLSYKNTETSIVTEYFNVHPMLSSNYVTVECYLNPQEYKSIKGGAKIHYDEDLYYVSEISGYDCTGTNTTKLKLIKVI